MSERLKQFIKEHRDAFDTEEPNPKLYNKIAEKITGGAKTRRLPLNRWKVAAVAITLLFITVTAYFLLSKKDKYAGSISKQPPPRIEEPYIIADPVYAKQIYHFQELIGLQQTELKQLEKEYPQLYHQFVNDITELDSSYRALKLKLPANPNREMLLEAMIQNLQLQSELLNRQLLIIKEIKQKSNKHETSI